MSTRLLHKRGNKSDLNTLSDGQFGITEDTKEVVVGTAGGNFSIVPPGVVWDFAGSSAPSGFLLCDGASYSRTTYANLFAVIGTAYGSEDINSFNVPDYRGRVSVGAGAGGGLTSRSVGDAGGEEAHQLSVGELPAHTHDYTSNGNSDYTRAGPYQAEDWNSPGNPKTRTSASTGSNEAHNNMPPYLVSNKIIKF